MRRMTMVAAAGVLGVAWLCLVQTPAEAGPEKTKADEKKELAKLMRTAHKGDVAPLTRLTKAVTTDEPNWDQLNKDVKVIADLARMLNAKQPYAAGRYAESASALEAAARKESRADLSLAVKGLKSSCNSCHYGNPLR